MINQPAIQVSPPAPAPVDENTMLGFDGKPIPTFSGRHQATETWAYITRNMWDDYVNSFVPKENELMDQTTYNNPAIVQQEIDKALPRVHSAINVQQGNHQQVLAGYGIAPSADAQRVNERRGKLSRSSELVDAANQIRQRLLDRNREIAGGIAGGDKEQLLGMADTAR